MNYGVFLESTQGIFMNLMVWVVFSVAVFEVINVLTHDKLFDKIKNGKKTQVLWGTILGLIPGCGGPLLMVNLYKKRTITIATLTATFIATFGDAAFIILAIKPMLYLHFMWIGAITALTVGYGLQISGLSNKIENWAFAKEQLPGKFSVKYSAIKAKTELSQKKQIDRNSAIYKIDKVYMPWILVTLAAVMLPFTIMNLIPNMRSSDIVHTGYQISYGITLGILGYYAARIIAFRFFEYNMDVPIAASSSWITKTIVVKSKTLTDHGAQFSEIAQDSFLQTLSITFWVWIGMFASNILFFYNEDGLKAFFGLGKGSVAILIGVLIGMIPGCGPQIAFANFALMSGSPVMAVALLANSINEDGDAAFALMAMQPKTALMMRLLNTVPAIVVGFAVWGITLAF